METESQSITSTIVSTGIAFFTILLTTFSLNAQWVETLAGSGMGYSDGIGANAEFHSPCNITYDHKGNIYVADWTNEKIRKIDLTTHQVTTIAGTSRGYKDTIGGYAKFNRPYGIVYDPSDVLYIADYGNHRIRKIDLATNLVTTLAGSVRGFADDTGTNARFNYPFDVEYVDGIVYVADRVNHSIRKINTQNNVVSTIAGNGNSGSNNGSGSTASFHTPEGLAADTNGFLYINDTGNNMIRKIRISSTNVSTVAGAPMTSGYKDDIGSKARFNRPVGIIADNKGNLFIGDVFNHVIRKIEISSKKVTTFAGTGSGAGTSWGTFIDDTNALEAGFYQPRGMDLDDKGNLFIADWGNHRIRKITCGLAQINIAASETLICPGENVQLIATGADTYQWTHGLGTGSTKTVAPVSDTAYIVTGTDSLNCMATDTIEILVKEVPDKPVISAFNSTLIISTLDTTIEAYQWLDCDNGMTPIPNATNSVYTPGKPGSFAVQVMRDSCVNISDCYTITGITKNSNSTAFKVYPNPNNGVFYIESDRNEPTSIILVDAHGQLVFEIKMSIAETSEIALPESIVNGVYLLKLESENYSENRKILIKR